MLDETTLASDLCACVSMWVNWYSLNQEGRLLLNIIMWLIMTAKN